MKILPIILIAFLMSCDEDPQGSSSVLKQVWKVKLNKVMGLQGFELPSIDGNYAYFPNGPDIECRELATGKQIWKKRVTNGTRDYIGTNFNFNSKIIVINDAYSTRALDKLTGEQLWIAPDSGVQRDYGFMSDIDENFGYRLPSILDLKRISRFDVLTGLTINEIQIDSGGFRSVKAAQMGIYSGTAAGKKGTNDEILYEFGTVKKYDPVTGNQVYSLRATPKWFNDVGYGFYPQTITNLFAVPVILDSVGYNVFRDGTVLKFRLSDGHMYWEYRLPLTNYRQDFPDAINVFPDEQKGLVFVSGGRDNWFCLDMETGKQLYWKRPSDNDGPIDPSSYDGNRYIFKPHVYTQWEWYIIDITTGEVVEEFDIPGDSILSQDVKDGYVAAFGVLNFYVFKIVR